VIRERFSAANGHFTPDGKLLHVISGKMRRLGRFLLHASLTKPKQKKQN
jgi:hypothetical protein